MLLDQAVAIVEEARIAAKLVYEKSCDLGRVLGWQHGLRADDLRDHAAAVDIACQDHGHVRRDGKAHIGDVVRAQVHFRRTARAFDENEVVPGAQPIEAFAHGEIASAFNRA